MSKERELLEWALIFLQPHASEEASNLHKEIEELLVQPEQPEQFPLPGERLIEMWRDGYDAGVRLAQTEQEPVAWMNDSGGCFLSDGNKYSENWTALYASPPKPERMTDDEISAVTAGHDPTPYGVHMFKMGIRWYEKYKSRVGVYDDSE